MFNFVWPDETFYMHAYIIGIHQAWVTGWTVDWGRAETAVRRCCHGDIHQTPTQGQVWEQNWMPHLWYCCQGMVRNVSWSQSCYGVLATSPGWLPIFSTYMRKQGRGRGWYLTSCDKRYLNVGTRSCKKAVNKCQFESESTSISLSTTVFEVFKDPSFYTPLKTLAPYLPSTSWNTAEPPI